jgi:hypothetical protein
MHQHFLTYQNIGMRNSGDALPCGTTHPTFRLRALAIFLEGLIIPIGVIQVTFADFTHQL